MDQVFLQKIEFEHQSKSGFSRIAITLSNETYWEIDTNLACSYIDHDSKDTYEFN